MINIDDKRYFLYKHVLSYTPVDESEKISKRKVVELLEGYPNCFERDNMPGHITGSALLVDEKRENVLLTHHRKIGKWLQFGGHSDGEENPFNVALRETVEESGITEINFIYPFSGIFDIDVHLIPEHNNIPKHHHYDVRILLTTNKDTAFAISDESIDLKWIKLDDVKNYNEQEEFLRIIEKVKNIN